MAANALESDEDILFRLWRVRRTAMQMCRDRGFVVSDEDHDQTFDQFQARFGSSPNTGEPRRSDLDTIIQHSKNQPENRLALYFPDDHKVGISTVRKIFDSLTENQAGHAVVIVKAGMTPSAKKALSDTMPSAQIQAFEEAELIVNITHHELVPKHELLSPEARKELMNRYKLKEPQFPRIKLSDPVARYYGMTRGQIVKITRESPTAGRYVTYRLVH